MTIPRSLRTALPLALVLLGVGACASDGEKSAYESATVTRPLDVPPDLTAPRADTAYPLPEVAPGTARLSAPQAGEDASGPRAPGVRLERDGAVRWLEIQAPPKVVWSEAKRFLTRQGFELALEAPRLGILETQWRENRHAVPRDYLERMSEKGGSSGLRDKYRIRVEQGATPEQTRVYITERGMQAVAADTGDGGADETAWAPRPADPELEAEMLQRMLLFLGVDKESAARQVAEKSPQRTRLAQQDGHAVLQVDEGFARTWRRTELALDRVGVIVSDRDRAKGVYYIRIPDSYVQQSDKKGRFFAGLFSGEKGAGSLPRDYTVRVAAAGANSRIWIEKQDGKAADPAFAERLLRQLQENLA